MSKQTVNGVEYLLPEHLNPFQLDLYVHLINWKWQYVTKAAGMSSGNDYDAILPPRS